MSKYLLRSGLDWAAPLCFGVAVCWLLPLGGSLQFGMDEGFELMKALLVSLGHPLYGDFWNDQPPLHTEVLALLFRWFGPSAAVGRGLSVACAVLLLGSVYQLVQRRSGRAVGWVAVLFLACAPYFLQLSVAVMLEVPALALALVAGWMGAIYRERRRLWWLVLSGGLFGCALQVKLTAALFLPALAVDSWVAHRRWRQRSDQAVEGHGRRFVVEAVAWGAGVAATFGLVALLFYRTDTLAIFWASHFSGGTRIASRVFRFDPTILVNEAALAPAMLGVVLAVWQRRWDLCFPLVLLGTLLWVHWWHRPFWHFYEVHFAVPLAWLGAVGVVEWLRAFQGLGWAESSLAKFGVVLGLAAWVAAMAGALIILPYETAGEAQELAQARPAKNDPVVCAFRRHAAQTHWVLSDDLIGAFWAGLPVPPEIAIIPSKRLWSGQIDRQVFLHALKRYRPEQILLVHSWPAQFGFEHYLQRHYRAAGAGEIPGLLLRRGAFQSASVK